MKKEEIELIIIKVTADEKDAINMKIYKNGTTCRFGVGGLPQLGISGMSFVDDSRYFDPIIEKVPQEVLDKPINYEEETPNGYLEYVIAFYGVSKNGDTGERADWSKSTGIRVKVDHQTKFNNPIMGLLDGLTMEAAELTNEWYFDVIMQIVFNAKSSTLPEQSILSAPKTKNEIQEDYENYVNQMLDSARKWDMSEYIKNKTYQIDGKTTQALISQVGNNFSINFLPQDDEDPFEILSMSQNTNPTEAKKEVKKKKPWWKF